MNKPIIITLLTIILWLILSILSLSNNNKVLQAQAKEAKKPSQIEEIVSDIRLLSWSIFLLKEEILKSELKLKCNQTSLDNLKVWWKVEDCKVNLERFIEKKIEVK